MKSVSLSVRPRTATRRSAAKKLRSNGRIPAVIYGKVAAPQALDIDGKELEKVLHHAGSEHFVLDLVVADDARPERFALLQEVQHHPLSGAILHVDFHEIRRDEKVEVEVPVEAIGEAYGVKNQGGILETVMHELLVRCLPQDLPPAITVDVSGLQLGQIIHIGDIVPPNGVEILGDKELSVFGVAEPRALVAEEAATEEAPAQPEATREKPVKAEDEKPDAKEKTKDKK